jgi:hypothetical protein
LAVDARQWGSARDEHGNLRLKSAPAKADPRKLLVSQFVLEHRLEPTDPLAPIDGAWEDAALTMLFAQQCRVTLEDTIALLETPTAR